MIEQNGQSISKYLISGCIFAVYLPEITTPYRFLNAMQQQ
jgi:hypothetical protein